MDNLTVEQLKHELDDINDQFTKGTVSIDKRPTLRKRKEALELALGKKIALQKAHKV